MKAKIRKFVMVLLAICLMISIIPESVQAAGWKQNKNGYWWEEKDYSYPKNQWKTIYGKQYHFNSKGYMDIGWTKIGSKWYYLGGKNDGAKKTYWQKVYGKYYWLANDGAMRTGWQKVYGKYYWLGTSNDGAMKTGWQKVYGKYYWLGASNDGAMKTGWQTVYGKRYYLGGANDGAMKTGWQQISGNWYYFGGANDGSLKTNTWIGNYYVDASGKWDKSKKPGVVKYLGADIKSSDSNYYYDEFDGSSTTRPFKLGGIAYKKGFVLSTDGGSYVTFNLGGKYKYLSGVAGNKDGYTCQVTYSFLGDGKLIGTIDINNGELPKEFTFNVSNVKQIKIIADGESGERVGFGNVSVYNNKEDKPKTFETSNSPSIAYLGSDIEAYATSWDYKSYDSTSPLKLGGIDYQKGFSLTTDKGRYANFNLEGKYKYLSGMAGNVDGDNQTVTYSFFGDGKVLGTLNIEGGSIPKEFTFNVSGVKQLKVISNGALYDEVGFGNAVVYKNEKDKPKVLETSNPPETSYLGGDIKSYTNGWAYKEYDYASSFKMGGIAYRKGFTLPTDNEGYANFNLEGKFKYLSGVAGNVDGSNYSVEYKVLGDGKLLGTIKIKGGSRPVSFSFNVNGVKQLSFVSQGNSNDRAGFGNVIVQNKQSKAQAFENEEISDNVTVYSEIPEANEETDEGVEPTQITDSKETENSEAVENSDEITEQEQAVEEEITVEENETQENVAQSDIEQDSDDAKEN